MASDWSANEAPKVARAYVLHLARTYQPGCVLAAACDLDLFEALGADAIEAQEIAERIRGDLRGTTILLDALAAIELIDKRDGRYLVPEAMRDLLSPGTPDSVLAMVQHQANCMRRWARLAETVRDGAQVETAPSVRGPARDTAAFIEAMDVINRGDAQRIVDELMPIQFDHLLDVGGASGTWTIAWLRANPRAQATLFDLPEVLPQAEDRLGSVGLMDRVDLVAGDFYSDRLPRAPARRSDPDSRRRDGRDPHTPPRRRALRRQHAERDARRWHLHAARVARRPRGRRLRRCRPASRRRVDALRRRRYIQVETSSRAWLRMK
jgi:hypothetical protein